MPFTYASCSPDLMKYSSSSRIAVMVSSSPQHSAMSMPR